MKFKKAYDDIDYDSVNLCEDSDAIEKSVLSTLENKMKKQS